ncbi:MAG: pirin family protein [Pseudomonadota bacterium]
MIRIRKGMDRGHANHGWLDARHTFSFANYHDPDQMNFRALRVMNEDRINPGAGFPAHPHEDMEIITYVLEGALAHKDSTGGGGVIGSGEIQYMAAGTGVRHSEFNASETDPVHLYQIWLLPDARGHTPRYEQRDFSEARKGKLALIASPDGADGSIRINQDVKLFASLLNEGETIEYRFNKDRYGWLQVARGGVELEDVMLQPGDGVKISDHDLLSLKALADDTDILLFDLN